MPQKSNLKRRERKRPSKRRMERVLRLQGLENRNLMAAGLGLDASTSFERSPTDPSPQDNVGQPVAGTSSATGTSTSKPSVQIDPIDFPGILDNIKRFTGRTKGVKLLGTSKPTNAGKLISGQSLRDATTQTATVKLQVGQSVDLYFLAGFRGQGNVVKSGSASLPANQGKPATGNKIADVAFLTSNPKKTIDKPAKSIGLKITGKQAGKTTFEFDIAKAGQTVTVKVTVIVQAKAKSPAVPSKPTSLPDDDRGSERVTSGNPSTIRTDLRLVTGQNDFRSARGGIEDSPVDSDNPQSARDVSFVANADDVFAQIGRRGLTPIDGALDPVLLAGKTSLL